jgi:hypothetical protein
MNKLYEPCRHCGFNLDGGDIFPELRIQPHFNSMSDEELHQYIRNTYPEPYRSSKAIGIELYDDRTQYYTCPNCHNKI